MGRIVLTSYISHGAPTSLVERTRIHDVYENLGRILREGGVDTVVVSSPHYLSRTGFEIESRKDIPCIQDYYGFPDELYKYSYEAKNNPALVSEILSLSKAEGLDVAESKSWGLDHGAWLPLYFMFPERDVKVVPVSITSSAPEDHFKFGSLIKAAVAKTDVMAAVIGTGSPVHRLDLIRYGDYGADRLEPGDKFDEKFIESLAAGEFDRMLAIRQEYSSLFRSAAPEGDLNPFYIALGASDRDRFVGKTILHEFMYYSVSLVAMILSADRKVRDSLDKMDLHGAEAK